jgi:hypothetical protein
MQGTVLMARTIFNRTISMDHDNFARLKALAEESTISMSALLRMLIKKEYEQEHQKTREVEAT